MTEHNAYEAAEALAQAAHDAIDMHAATANGGPDEAAFSLVIKGVAYTVTVRPLRYHEAPESMGAASAAQFLAEMQAEQQRRLAAAMSAVIRFRLLTSRTLDNRVFCRPGFTARG